MKHDMYSTIISDGIEYSAEHTIIKIISDMSKSFLTSEKIVLSNLFFDENMQKSKTLDVHTPHLCGVLPNKKHKKSWNKVSP